MRHLPRVFLERATRLVCGPTPEELYQRRLADVVFLAKANKVDPAEAKAAFEVVSERGIAIATGRFMGGQFSAMAWQIATHRHVCDQRDGVVQNLRRSIGLARA